MNWHYLYVFFQSNLLEVAFLVFFYRLFDKETSSTAIGLGVTAMNSFSHPIVVFLLVKGGSTYLNGIVTGELFAFITEVIAHRYLFNINFKQAIAGSLLANLLSWQLGPILTTIIFLSDKV